MAWDFAFSQVTKDTVPDGKGSVVLTNGAETQLQLQFDCDFAAWWGDPKAGSKLRNLRLFDGDTSEVAIQAEALRALGVLVDAAVITNATASATPDPNIPGRVRLLTTSRDTRTGRTIKTGTP